MLMVRWVCKSRLRSVGMKELEYLGDDECSALSWVGPTSDVQMPEEHRECRYTLSYRVLA